MVTDEQARRIALFFFLTLMDEKIAIQAASRVVARLKAKPGVSKNASPSESQIELIELLLTTLQTHRKLRSRTKLLERGSVRQETTPSAADAKAPGSFFLEHADIGPWTRFRRNAGDPEAVAVVLSKVLNFSDADIAAGVKASTGTVRYRIGKGIRHLGEQFGK